MPVFGLTFLESALVIVFINILGIMPVCFFATFGPKFGLRQMILSRFYFGYYGAKLSKDSPARRLRFYTTTEIVLLLMPPTSLLPLL